MDNRRKFLKKAAAAGFITASPGLFWSGKNSFYKGHQVRNMIWGNLLHLSYNMWEDHIPDEYADEDFECNTCMDARLWAHGYRPRLTFDDETWDKLLKEMAGAGMNLVLIDVGDGIQYESHPEIAVKNAWSASRLRRELAKLRKMGLEPIPKLNFATTHDIWLGEYARMVSTDRYYAVCRDLIEELLVLFDRPRFFHLGMDEETASHQQKQKYAVIRQHDLWWHDLYFYVDVVERNGSRAWVWSDYGWHHTDLFFRKMPLSVLQSNWYYGTDFGPGSPRVKFYDELDKHGYDQVPTGSNHSHPDNFGLTVEYCRQRIDPSRLYGFLTAPWRPTLSPCLERHREAIGQVDAAMKSYNRLMH